MTWTGWLGTLAATTPAPSPSPTQRQFSEADLGITPGLLSLLAFVLLALTIIVIWRSMNARLKKIDLNAEPRVGSATVEQDGGRPGSHAEADDRAEADARAEPGPPGSDVRTTDGG